MDEHERHELETLLWHVIRTRDANQGGSAYERGWRDAADTIEDIIRHRLGMAPRDGDDYDDEDTFEITDKGRMESSMRHDATRTRTPDCGPYVYEDNGIQVAVLRPWRHDMKQRKSP